MFPSFGNGIVVCSSEMGMYGFGGIFVVCTRARACVLAFISFMQSQSLLHPTKYSLNSDTPIALAN
jgi:hypothetical protein